MKNCCLFLIAFCFGLTTQAQIINFADANFKAKLLDTNTIDTNHDGEIEVSEALLVERIYFSDAAVASLGGIEYFSNLKQLQFSSSVPLPVDIHLLSNLESFSAFGCRLTSLNLAGLHHLKSIYVRQTTATLPTVDLSGLTSLESLSFDGCGITSLNLTGLNNLQVLSLINDPLASLDVHGLPSLIYISISNTPLASMDVTVVPTLQYLYCEDNQFSALNLTGLAELRELRCNNNHITALDFSDNPTLYSLECDNNQLTTLDLSANTQLHRLSCSGNLLTDLDLSHSTFTDVWCDSNHLTALNLKNSFIDGEIIYGNHGQVNGHMQFNNNPNLQYICVDDIELNYIQEKITQYGYTNCHINSYCSFNPGGTFYTIAGTNKFDADANGCDENDNHFSHLKLGINDGTVSGSMIPDGSGNYSIPVQAGIHTVTPILENPAYFSVSPTSATITFPTETSPFTQNFCITPVGVHNDLEVNIIPVQRPRPGFDAIYKIVYKNKGNQIMSGTVNFAYNDAVLDFVSASVTPSSQPMNYINWDFINLQPLDTKEILVTFNLNSPTEVPPVNGGFALYYTLSINSASNDEMPEDNIYILHQTVVNSFDPNHKECLEGNTMTPDMVGKYLHYVIRFENTGTANAENIVVKDIIDTTKFDISSLVPIAGSHPFMTKISGSNKVEFILENINLPFDDAHNDGYIAFKIKTNPNLNPGDLISNTASIYFDFNAPIVTEPAVTTIQLLANQTFESDTAITITPNPADALIHISGITSTDYTIEVTDILGKTILQKNNSNTIDVSHLTRGVYLVTLKQAGKVTTQKLIKN